MLAYISALLLLGLVLFCIALQKTYYYFPAKELKRQARAGDHEAAVLYKAVAYGSSLRLLLWLGIGFLVAASFLLLQSVAPAWLVFVAVTGFVWYGFAWSPNARVSGTVAWLTLRVTPLVAWVLYYSHSILDFIARNIDRHRPVTFHTGLYEREDLVDLVKTQREMPGSRISHAELDLVVHALSFGEKTVQSIMVPKRLVKAVHRNDVIGPILMDELYESEYSRFPVLESDDTQICGVLYLRDLILATHGGMVSDVMKPTVHYVHEDQTLYQVLHAFLSTKHHMFVVINSAEEYIGVITIEDVLEQVIGRRIVDDFEAYDDRRAVAESIRERKHAKSPEPTADTDKAGANEQGDSDTQEQQ